MSTVAAVVLWSGLLVAPPVQPAGADVAALSRLESVWNVAHLHGDADALDRLWADELVVIVPGMRPMTRAEALGALRSGRMKFEHYETPDVGIRAFGNAGVVTGRLRRGRRAEGRVFEDDWLFTKVYVRRGGEWRVVSFHASASPAASTQGVPRMTLRATGTFEVVLKPQAEPESQPGAVLGRMSIEKTFHGDLRGTGKGEMLTAVTETKGSAGYVAIERVTGTIHGREGSFVFQHTGTMSRGSQDLSITVVPDSGTGQLAGITGRFMLKIVDGKHHYEFDYSLPQ